MSFGVLSKDVSLAAAESDYPVLHSLYVRLACKLLHSKKPENATSAGGLAERAKPRHTLSPSQRRGSLFVNRTMPCLLEQGLQVHTRESRP